jgi:hypothetical protein
MYVRDLPGLVESRPVVWDEDPVVAGVAVLHEAGVHVDVACRGACTQLRAARTKSRQERRASTPHDIESQRSRASSRHFKIRKK